MHIKSILLVCMHSCLMLVASIGGVVFLFIEISDAQTSYYILK